MKIYYIFCICVFVIGCSSSPPKPPKPKGNKSLVNPVYMNLDLLLKEEI